DPPPARGAAPTRPPAGGPPPPAGAQPGLAARPARPYRAFDRLSVPWSGSLLRGLGLFHRSQLDPNLGLVTQEEALAHLLAPMDEHRMGLGAHGSRGRGQRGPRMHDEIVLALLVAGKDQEQGR